MSIKAEIVCDSINICNNRLTTFVLEYPRFIHAELLTHRVFSKNSASSRAIPIDKMIERVINDPAIPIYWGKNQSGMQAREELDNVIKKHKSNVHELEVLDYTDLEQAKNLWLTARDGIIIFVKELNKLGLHKQICNRLLEPWFNIRIILTSNEFENFFALRAHADAQPELAKLAELMLEAYNNSIPKFLEPGEWHIPFGDKIDVNKLENFWKKDFIQFLNNSPSLEDIPVNLNLRQKRFFENLKIKIAIARCARVSYYNYEGKDDYEADIKLCDRLFGSNPKHLSPTEHVAVALSAPERIGNFIGWRQYRKMFKDENLADPRVKHYVVVNGEVRLDK